jgi:hypothetical protein
MRRIISKEAEEKKRRKNQLIIGIILIAVMIFSVLGYSLSSFGNNNSSGSVVNYNGFKFTQTSNFWNVNVGSYAFSFAYNPTQTEKINSALNLLNSYSGKPLYISSENNEAEIEIYKNLFYQNQIVQRIQEACLQGEKCNGDYPKKTCQDNFIIIKESNSSEIKQQNNCVFIEGNKGNLTKLSDSFLFKISGVQ